MPAQILRHWKCWKIRHWLRQVAPGDSRWYALPIGGTVTWCIEACPSGGIRIFCAHIAHESLLESWASGPAALWRGSSGRPGSRPGFTWSPGSVSSLAGPATLPLGPTKVQALFFPGPTGCGGRAIRESERGHHLRDLALWTVERPLSQNGEWSCSWSCSFLRSRTRSYGLVQNPSSRPPGASWALRDEWSCT